MDAPKFHYDEGLNWFEVVTSRAAEVMQYVPGSAIVGAEAEGPVLRVPWDQHAAEVLAQLRVPHLPPMLRDYTFAGTKTPFPHQYRMAGTMSTHRKFFCLADMGCVDADTEYLSPTGWVRIADYKGGEVAQYHPSTGAAEFVEPQEYVAKPCEEMWHFTASRGVDQMLSPEHRVLFKNPNTGQMEVKSAEWVARQHRALQQGFNGKFPTAFNLQRGDGIDLTDAEIRVQIAVCADGYFQSGGRGVAVRVLKERKKLRLRELLTAAGIEWGEVTRDYRTAVGYTVFRFKAPWRAKTLAGFWTASTPQLEVIADELVHWDGCDRTGSRGAAFSTRCRGDADFAQYAYCATGRAASISATTRKNGQYAGSVDYAVNVRGRGHWVGIASTGETELKDANCVRVVAPGGMKYCFMVPSSFLVFRRNGKVFCSGNTGKTLSALWAIDYLFSIGAVKHVLILCPKSIVRTAWLAEISASVPHLSATVLLHADPLIRRRKAQSLSHIHIANYNAVEICYDEMVGRYDLIVIDESTAYKKYGTRRWKFLRPLVAEAARCWMLTGTPSVQYPVDAYGQIKLMYQEAWDMTESRFKLMTMQQHSKYRWVPLEDAAETVHEAMQPAIVIHKRDVLTDLPPITFSMRQVELSVDQKRFMKELRKTLVIETKGTTVSAVHAAALRTKILQIASGTVYDDNGAVVDIECKDRLNELVSLCEQVRAQDDGRGPPAHKVMVVCAFTHTVERVQRELNATGLKFGILHGGISLKKREKILHSMETDRELDGVVVQPEVVSHGVTLVSCTTTVFYTPFDKAEVALQVQNRMDRPGQKHPMQIIKLSGCPAEDLLYERMDQRIDFHHEVVGQYDDFVQAL